MLQGDHGSAIVFLFIACGMLFSAGLAWKYILTAGGLTIAALPVIWYGLMDEDKRMRFITLFNPDLDPTGSGYQQRLGRIALGSGKLWGKGIFSCLLYTSLLRYNILVPKFQKSLVSV